MHNDSLECTRVIKSFLDSVLPIFRSTVNLLAHHDRIPPLAFFSLIFLAGTAMAQPSQPDPPFQQRKREVAIERAKAALAHKPDSPRVDAIYTVAPDIVAVRIRAQELKPSHQEPFAKKDGDELIVEGGSPFLKRDGKNVAWVIGPKHDTVTFFQGIQGDALLEALSDVPDTFRISSQTDPHYQSPVAPVAVYRKSKPVTGTAP